MAADVAFRTAVAMGSTSVPRKIHLGAKVEIRLDATAIASLVKVSAEERECVTKANVVTCIRTMDLKPDGEVTGLPVRDFVIAATALIVPGVLLSFAVTRRPRRAHRRSG